MEKKPPKCKKPCKKKPANALDCNPNPAKTKTSK